MDLITFYCYKLFCITKLINKYNKYFMNFVTFDFYLFICVFLYKTKLIIVWNNMCIGTHSYSNNSVISSDNWFSY